MATSNAMKKAIVKKVVAMLEAAGIDYALVDPDGEVLGNLDVRREGEAGSRGPNANDWDAETDYVRKLKELQPNEVLIFDIADPDTIPEGMKSTRSDSFGASMRGVAKRLWGADNFIVTREKGHFEIMRM